MKNRNSVIGAFAIIIAASLWGLDGVALTPQLFNLMPNTGFIVFLLHLTPFALMNLYLHKEYRHLKDFTKKDVLVFLLIGLFGGSLGTISIVKALSLVQFQHLSIVVLLQKLQPIFAIVLAYFLLGEKIRKGFFVWALVAVFASYTLTFGFQLPHLNTDTNLFQASLWAILAAFSFGSSTVFSKMALKKFSFYTTNFYRFGFTTLIMFIFVLITGTLGTFSNVTPRNWLFFFIIALTVGTVAAFLYYFGLNKVKAIVSTICELFFPISAIMFDYIINGKMLSIVQWVSAGIMITAILKISYRKEVKTVAR